MPEWLPTQLLITIVLAITSSAVIASLVTTGLTHRFNRKLFLRSKLEDCLIFHTEYNKDAAGNLFVYSGVFAGHLTTPDDFQEALNFQSEDQSRDAWAKLHAAGRLYFSDLHELLNEYVALQVQFANFENQAFEVLSNRRNRLDEDLEHVKVVSRQLDSLNNRFVAKCQNIAEKYSP